MGDQFINRKTQLKLVSLIAGAAVFVTAFSTYGEGPRNNDRARQNERRERNDRIAPPPVRGDRGRDNGRDNRRNNGLGRDVAPIRRDNYRPGPVVDQRQARRVVRQSRRDSFKRQYNRTIQRQNRMNHNHSADRWRLRQSEWNRRYVSYRPAYPRSLFAVVVLGVAFPLYIEGRVWNYNQIEQATDALEELSMDLYEEAVHKLGHSPYNNNALSALYDVVEAAEALENKVNYNYSPSSSLYELFYLNEMIDLARPHFTGPYVDYNLSNKFQILSYQVDELQWHYRHYR